MDKISIIIPIYNVEKYVKKCIESAINQTYKNIEIILVNDGSTDNSKKILDSFKNDKRIIIIHKKNGGVSSARNVGIKASTGKYICFIDGDDYVSSDYVEYLYKLIKNNNSNISVSLDFFTDYNIKQNKKERVAVVSGEQAAIDIMCYKILIGVNNKMFESKLIKNNVLFDERLCIGEGFNFNTDAFQRAKSVVLGNKKIYYYRKNNDESVTTKFDGKKWENGLYAIDLIKEKMIINSSDMINAWHYAKWRTNVDVFNLILSTNNKKNYLDLYKRCYSISKKDWKYAFKSNVKIKEKIRAIMILIFPKMHPFIYKLRKKLFIRR